MSKTLKLNDTNKIVIDTFKGTNKVNYLNVRKFYKKKGEDDWLPGRQGFSIEEEHIEEFLRKLSKVALTVDEAEELEPRKKSDTKKRLDRTERTEYNKKPKSKSREDDEEDDAPKKKKKRDRDED